MAAGPPTANHTPALAEAEHQHVLHTLIQEAQQEIGRLRAELYSTSRLADERKYVFTHATKVGTHPSIVLCSLLTVLLLLSSTTMQHRQALDAITAARDQLAAVAHQLEEKVQVMHSQLMQLPQLQHELKVLHEQQQQVDKDRAVQMQVGHMQAMQALALCCVCYARHIHSFHCLFIQPAAAHPARCT